VLAQGTVGYARLARAISEGQMAGEKGAPRTSHETLAGAARARVHGHDASAHNDSWFVLTGCRKGAVPAALQRDGPAAAERELHRLIDAFGRDRVLVELWDHGDPLDRHRNDALVQCALRTGVEVTDVGALPAPLALTDMRARFPARTAPRRQLRRRERHRRALQRKGSQIVRRVAGRVGIGDVRRHQLLPRAQQIHVAFQLSSNPIQHDAVSFCSSVATLKLLKQKRVAVSAVTIFCRAAKL
jgi:hypothetical protein